MFEPNFEEADGLGIGITFEPIKIILSIHKQLSMLKKIEYAQNKF